MDVRHSSRCSSGHARYSPQSGRARNGQHFSGANRRHLHTADHAVPCWRQRCLHPAVPAYCAAPCAAAMTSGNPTENQGTLRLEVPRTPAVPIAEQMQLCWTRTGTARSCNGRSAPHRVLSRMHCLLRTWNMPMQPTGICPARAVQVLCVGLQHLHVRAASRRSEQRACSNSLVCRRKDRRHEQCGVRTNTGGSKRQGRRARRTERTGQREVFVQNEVRMAQPPCTTIHSTKPGDMHYLMYGLRRRHAVHVPG